MRRSSRDAVDWLHRVDGLLSLYKPDRNQPRADRPASPSTPPPPFVLSVFDLCRKYEAETGRYSTAYP